LRGSRVWKLLWDGPALEKSVLTAGLKGFHLLTSKGGGRIILGCSLLLLLLIGILGWGRDMRDDAFVTYRYARNLIEGRGFVFNEGQQDLGTTAPLYGLLMAGLGLIHRNIPLMSHCLGVLAVGWMACVGYRLFRGTLSFWVGLLFAFLICVDGFIPSIWGMEAPFQCAVILSGFLALRSKRSILAGILFGVAVWVRVDAVIFLMALGCSFVLTRERDVLVALALACLLTGLGAGICRVLYGSPFPTSATAKAVQALNPRWPGFGGRIDEHFLVHMPLLIPFLSMGAFATLTRHRKFSPFLFWGLGHGMAYALWGVPAYDWYFVPLTVSGLALACVGIHYLMGEKTPAKAVLVLAAVLAVHAGCQMLDLRSEFFLHDGPRRVNRYRVYRDVAAWIEENAPEDASVGIFEIGVVGYHTSRKVIDFCGLVHPEAVPHLKRLDYLWIFRHFQPEFLCVGEEPRDAMVKVVESLEFKRGYVERYRSRHGAYCIVIYGMKESAA